MGSFLLAIDQGTTGTTTLVVEVDSDSAIRVRGRGYAEFPQHFPQPGWVEHDLEEIWSATMSTIPPALQQAGVVASDIAALAITNQRETTGVWRTNGEPAHRAIVWQDRRTAERCQALRDAGYENMIREQTGLLLDPYFSGTKLAWLLDAAGLRAAAESGELRFGTMDTWLVWRLTGGTAHVTDATNASRTLLFDIRRGDWDASLLEAVGDIPRAVLPTVLPSAGEFGHTKGVPGLPDGIPITGIAGDQHAALFGQACFAPGMAKCTYGTGAFALVNTGEDCLTSEHGLVSTIAWQLGDVTTYALEGSIFTAGAIVQWLRDGLGIISHSSDIEALAASVPDNGGVTLVPALTGLGAPHWRPEARGLIYGLTRGTTRAHIARAALEGIAFQVYDLLNAMHADAGRHVSVLRADGGAAANDLLMQFQADLLGVELHRPAVLESTALGAACLAGLGVGVFSGLEDIEAGWQLDKSFTPSMPQEQVSEMVHTWRSALMRA